MAKAEIVEELEHLRRSLDEVHPDPRNPNQHPLESIRAIKASMAEHGQDQPIVARAQTGRIVKGNGRYMAAKQLGWEDAAVLMVEDGELEALRRGLADHGAERTGFVEQGALEEALAQAKHDEEPVAGFDPKVLERVRENMEKHGEGDEGTSPEEARRTYEEGDQRQVVLYFKYEDWLQVDERLQTRREEAGVDSNADLFMVAVEAWEQADEEARER